MERKKVLRRISYFGLAVLILLLVALAGRGGFLLYRYHKMKNLPTKGFNFDKQQVALVTVYDPLVIGGVRYYPEVKGGVKYYAANEAEREKLSAYWGDGDNLVTVDTVKVSGIINALNTLEFGEIEDDKNVQKIYNRESYNGKCVSLTVNENGKNTIMKIFDRYVYIMTPWDSVKTAYYIQNYDKRNTTQDLIMAMVE